MNRLLTVELTDGASYSYREDAQVEYMHGGVMVKHKRPVTVLVRQGAMDTTKQAVEVINEFYPYHRIHEVREQWTTSAGF